MSGSAHNIFIHPIPQFTLPPLPRGPMYIKNPSNFYIQNIMSNALKSILNGTWIEQAPVFSRTPTHSLGYLTSSACIKRNVPATKKKKGLCDYVIRSFHPVHYIFFMQPSKTQCIIVDFPLTCTEI